MADDPRTRAREAMAARFGEAPDASDMPEIPPGLDALLDRRACRRFRAEPVPEPLLHLVLATGFAAPSKSDLQQADMVWVRDPAIRAEVTRDCGDWLAEAPAEVEILVVCGDGRRLRRLYGPDWANDHVDALFNPTGDAAILLGQLVSAATLAGLGACPISVMRNRAEAVSAALALPERVFPFAGLAIGWAAAPRAPISPRLGPAGALHIDRFDADGQDAAVAAYDARRGPVGKGASWTDAKRHQYSTAQRAGWGAFLRAKGFRME
ncbi:MAG: nitroreductase family protein [Pseudomonadota bacterium]